VDFEAAFYSHQAPLFRYVIRLVGDADLAADVVQESFVRLLSNPLPDADVRRWLFTVATNLVRDDARMRTRRQRLLAERYDRSDLASDPIDRPDEEMVRTEQIAAARRALDQLSQRDRQMLLMREEGFRYSEIADVIGVAPGSVGTLLARALRRFAKVLDSGYGQPESDPTG